MICTFQLEKGSSVVVCSTSNLRLTSDCGSKARLGNVDKVDRIDRNCDFRRKRLFQTTPIQQGNDGEKDKVKPLASCRLVKIVITSYVLTFPDPGMLPLRPLKLKVNGRVIVALPEIAPSPSS